MPRASNQNKRLEQWFLLDAAIDHLQSFEDLVEFARTHHSEIGQ
jgi:hypothetical protein